jgi:predicted secreted protein
MATDKNHSTEAAEEQVNTNAIAELREIIAVGLEKTEGKPANKRWQDAKKKTNEIVGLLNSKVRKIKNLKVEVAEQADRIEGLETELESVPKYTIVALGRPESWYTRVDNPNDNRDTFEVKSDASAVSSRIKPIVDVDTGVIGMQVTLTEGASHIIMFHNFISVCELRDGRKYNVDDEDTDALEVYLTAMRAAFKIADVYAEMFGEFSVIPVTTRTESLPTGAVVAGQTLAELSGSDEEEDDDSEEEGSEEESDSEEEGDGSEEAEDASDDESDADVEEDEE